MRAELIYTCEECGAEFARKNRPAAPILCKRCRDRAWERRRRAREREKRKPGISKLAQVAAEARAHGMTYGKWVAQKEEHSGY